MYDFYYNQMASAANFSTQTRTLLLENQTEDVYKNMSEDQDLYNTSDYSKKHPLHCTRN